MRPTILCRERLNRILLVLQRQGGVETIRQLSRRFSIRGWEIEQAADLGWVKVEIRKPRVGRPSQIVGVSKTPTAKLPRWRCQIENEITRRHWLFAMRATLGAVKNGVSAFGPFGSTDCWTDAYQRTFGRAKSRAGARASASRLIRRPDIIAMRAWWYGKINQRIPLNEQMPNTTSAVRQKVCEKAIGAVWVTRPSDAKTKESTHKAKPLAEYTTRIQQG